MKLREQIIRLLHEGRYKIIHKDTAYEKLRIGIQPIVNKDDFASIELSKRFYMFCDPSDAELFISEIEKPGADHLAILAKHYNKKVFQIKGDSIFHTCYKLKK